MDTYNSYLATIVEQSTDAIYNISLKGNILTWNNGAQKTYGYSSKEMNGKPVSVLLPKNRKNEINKILNKIKKGKVLENFQTTHLDKKGNDIYISITAYPVKNEKDIIIASLIVGKLIKDHKEEDSLKGFGKKYRDIIKYAPIGIVESNREGKILNANLAFVKMLGYSKLEEVLELNIAKDIYADKNIRNHILDQVVKGGLEKGIDIQLIKKKGEIIWVHLNSNLIKDESGNPLYFQNFLIDINKKRQFQQRLIEQEQNYRSLIESSVDPIYVLQNEKLLLVNQAWIKLFGYVEQEIHSSNFNIYKIIAPESRKTIEERIRFYKKAGIPLSNLYEMSGLTKDGKIIPLEVSVSKIIWNGKPALQGVYRDITERKYRENLLLEAKEAAERSDRLKTEFLAQMSHEIRTPLNNILTYSTLLKEELEDKLPKDLDSVFNVIDTSSHRLIRTIDLILNLSKIQTGNFDTNFEAIDLDKDILEDVVLEFLQKAINKKLKLIYKNKTNDCIIYGDNYSVSQIFINLIENAIKFTEKGKITITIDNYRDKIRVSVADTGIGITKENQKNVFQPFMRENQGYYPGAGLGLSLITKYAEINNAFIKLKSTKWKGSTFSVLFEKVNSRVTN